MPHEIDIVFENNTTPKSLGNARDEYRSHPGFLFGDSELNGLWFAKFETTGDINNPTVLPSETSLVDLTLKDQFETSLKFNDYDISKEAHMIKNKEWGAAAYLSHSKYGINKEARLNNNENYTTGCGASSHNGSYSANCQIEFGSNTNDLPQSTTGNITGIFDMSGGAIDRVMGNLNNILEWSLFEEMPDPK